MNNANNDDSVVDEVAALLNLEQSEHSKQSQPQTDMNSSTEPIWMNDSIMNAINQLIYAEPLDSKAIYTFLANDQFSKIQTQLKRCMSVIAYNRDCVECQTKNLTQPVSNSLEAILNIQSTTVKDIQTRTMFTPTGLNQTDPPSVAAARAAGGKTRR